MSGLDRTTGLGRSSSDRSTQRLSPKTAGANVAQMRLCSACHKEFTLDDYLDHVYDNDECYRAYLASEKKEMSKQ
jgi:hypothetical protein